MKEYVNKYVDLKVLGAALAVALVAGFVWWNGKSDEPAKNNQQVSAQTTEQKSKEEAKKEETKATADYKYVAQAGDTYSQFARKAIQSYGKVNKVNLTQGQIIFAETTLTQTAGSPLLNVGEERTVTESAVKDVVEKATKLTDAQKTAWAAYAVGVDFNTDQVGEKR